MTLPANDGAPFEVLTHSLGSTALSLVDVQLRRGKKKSKNCHRRLEKAIFKLHRSPCLGKALCNHSMQMVTEWPPHVTRVCVHTDTCRCKLGPVHPRRLCSPRNVSSVILPNRFTSACCRASHIYVCEIVWALFLSINYGSCRKRLHKCSQLSGTLILFVSFFRVGMRLHQDYKLYYFHST